MEFEGLICPNCSSTLLEQDLKKVLACKNCKVNFKQKQFLGFLEYLMMQGIVQDIDFFDSTLYGDEIQIRTTEMKELEDETNPEDYEDKTDRLNHYDEKTDLKEVTTNEEEFREWDGIDDDWEEFNKKNAE